jgi:hypothetical protein
MVSFISRQPKLPGYRPLTPALDSNRSPYTSIDLHLVHPSVFHEPCLQGKCSRNQDPAVDYFYSAAKRRSRGALWPIFAPALIGRFFMREFATSSQESGPNRNSSSIGHNTWPNNSPSSATASRSLPAKVRQHKTRGAASGGGFSTGWAVIQPLDALL